MDLSISHTSLLGYSNKLTTSSLSFSSTVVVYTLLLYTSSEELWHDGEEGLLSIISGYSCIIPL